MVFKDKYTQIHKQTLFNYSKLSTAKRLQCASLLVSKDNTRVLAVGYNGTPSGLDNTCEYIDQISLDCCNTVISNNNQAIDHIDKFLLHIDKCPNCNKSINKDKINISIKTKSIVVHAEANLITYCAKYGISTQDNIIYITHSPCIECAKLILSSGIKQVFYVNEYRKNDGLLLLKQSNINITSILNI